MACEDIEERTLSEIEKVVPPALPVAQPVETVNSREQQNNVLRLFFNRLTDALNKLAQRVGELANQITEILSRLDSLEESVTNLQNNIYANRPCVKFVASTSYTISSVDENCLIVFTSNSNVAVTVPRDSTDDLDDTEGGFITHIHQYGSGILTIGGEAGAVAFSYAQSLSTRKAGSALSLFKLEPDSWSVVGDQE